MANNAGFLRGKLSRRKRQNKSAETRRRAGYIAFMYTTAYKIQRRSKGEFDAATDKLGPTGC